MVFRA